MSNGEGTTRDDSDNFVVPENEDVVFQHPDIEGAAEDIAPGYKDALNKNLEFDPAELDKKIDSRITAEALEREYKEREKARQLVLLRAKQEKFVNPLEHIHEVVTLVDFIMDTLQRKPQGHELTAVARITISRISDPDDLELLAEAIETDYLQSLEATVLNAGEELDYESQKLDDNYYPGGPEKIARFSEHYNDLLSTLRKEQETAPKASALLRQIADVVREKGPEV